MRLFLGANHHNNIAIAFIFFCKYNDIHYLCNALLYNE